MVQDYIKYDELSGFKDVYAKSAEYYNLCISQGRLTKEKAEKSFDRYLDDILFEAEGAKSFKLFTILSAYTSLTYKNIDIVQRKYDKMLSNGSTDFVDIFLSGCERLYNGNIIFGINLLEVLDPAKHQNVIKYLLNKLNIEQIDKSHLEPSGIVTSIDLVKIAAEYNLKSLFGESMKNACADGESEEHLAEIIKILSSSSNHNLLYILLPKLIEEGEESDGFDLFDACMNVLLKMQISYPGDSGKLVTKIVPDVNSFVTDSEQNILHLILEARDLPLLRHFKEKYLTSMHAQNVSMLQSDQYGLYPIHYAAEISDNAFIQELSDMVGFKQTCNKLSNAKTSPLSCALQSKNYGENSPIFTLLKLGAKLEESFSKFEYGKLQKDIKEIGDLEDYPALSMIHQLMEKNPVDYKAYRPEYKVFGDNELALIELEDQLEMDKLHREVMSEKMLNESPLPKTASKKSPEEGADDSSGYWSSGSDSSHDRDSRIKELEWCDRCQTTSLVEIIGANGTVEIVEKYADF